MIRFATADDADAIAKIHVDTWRAAYDGLIPASFLASLSKQDRAAGWRRQINGDPRSLLVTTEANAVSGWIALGASRNGRSTDEGEIFALYVRPGRWRNGLGRALMEAAETELWRRNLLSSTLWVLERNFPARAFYERIGYHADGLKKDIPFPDATLVEVRYSKQKAEQTRSSLTI
jgi:GNAT superfamily N-acetyltransferase